MKAGNNIYHIIHHSRDSDDVGLLASVMDCTDIGAGKSLATDPLSGEALNSGNRSSPSPHCSCTYSASGFMYYSGTVKRGNLLLMAIKTHTLFVEEPESA